MAYVEKHKEGGERPSWFYNCDEPGKDRPDTYPSPQPHLATREFDKDWQANISALGLIGLLIESVVWNGMAIDQHLIIWQQKEHPIEILETPYQLLQRQVHAAVARARTRVEWTRVIRPEVRIPEIDRELVKFQRHTLTRREASSSKSWQVMIWGKPT